MARPKTHGRKKGDDRANGAAAANGAAGNEEDVGLLAAGQHEYDDELHHDDDNDDDGDDDLGAKPRKLGADGGSGGGGGEGTRTPRSANRVRFDLTPTVASSTTPPPPPPPDRPDAFGIFTPRDAADDDDPDAAPDSSSKQHRMPLLTNREAPGVVLANTWDDEDNEDNEDENDVHSWAERERRRPKSGLRSAFMNMANSIIGAGIIGQPYAFRQAGLLAGAALLVSLTVVVDWTIRLIVVNSKLSGGGSFQATVERCFGRPGLVAISVAQWAFAFGGMVAFGVIVGDSIPHVLSAVWPGLRDVPVLGVLADRRGAIVVFILGVSYPLTLYRDIAKLAKASTLALISMMVILVTVVVQGILTPKAERGSFSLPLLTINGGIFQAIGVISFAFVCHHNSLLIYGSLKTPTMDRFAAVTHYSTGISMIACLAMALAGFLTFGDRTLGNVLNNFASDNTMVNVARLCFGLNMLTTMPLEAFVCREVMLNYFWPGEEPSLKLHVLLSSGLVAGALAVSLATCDLGAVFELVGATSACALAYVLPPLCYIKLTTRSWKTYAAAGVVFFGGMVMVISVVQAVVKMINHEGDSAQCM